MLVKIEARIVIFPGTDFHFPSTSVSPGTFLGSGRDPRNVGQSARGIPASRRRQTKIYVAEMRRRTPAGGARTT